MTKPTNYEEEMVDLSPRNDYESCIIRDKIHVDYRVMTWVSLLDGLQAIESKWNFMTK